MRLLKNSILPLAAILLIAVLGQYIYIVDGQVDLFRLVMVYGVPFGIPYMLFVIPIGGSISRGIGILALNVIVGALFGSVIAVFAFIRAVVYLMAAVFGAVGKVHR
ncbi:DUF6050 family protein [Lactonifactor longoviformis]|uniref:DUF6050 family protein n=1 Tax=Lactonifactor longoviformis TaxID=341220 RepID=UPI001D02F0F9|nr:DUF6050 family protein [Lactonifactor longoviformis]MCB5715057.1 DUF6050 family protein [Lactonifactor longoviformis]MCB5719024.1 DUF6050 family protein [Lactonifactor longoviformis]